MWLDFSPVKYGKYKSAQIKHFIYWYHTTRLKFYYACQLCKSSKFCSVSKIINLHAFTSCPIHFNAFIPTHFNSFFILFSFNVAYKIDVENRLAIEQSVAVDALMCDPKWVRKECKQSTPLYTHTHTHKIWNIKFPCARKSWEHFSGSIFFHCWMKQMCSIFLLYFVIKRVTN